MLRLRGLEVQSGTSVPAETRASPARLEALKTQLDQIKADYEKRIRDLEAQVQQLQVQMLQTAPESQLVAASPQAESQPVQSRPGALNPAIAVIGNFVGRADSKKVFEEGGERIDKKFNLREAEIDTRVPIDPYADGVSVAWFESAVPGNLPRRSGRRLCSHQETSFPGQTAAWTETQSGAVPRAYFRATQCSA